MSLKISQPPYGLFHSFSKPTRCQHFGTFYGFQVRPVCPVKLSNFNFNVRPFTRRNISERRAHVVDIRLLLFVLALKAVHEQTMNNGYRFQGGSTKPNRQSSSREQYRDNTHSQQHTHRSKHQKTSGGQRNNGPKAPNVARPDMAKVNEAFNKLELRGNSLESITESQVNKAFKKKALVYHPDKVHHEDKDLEAKKKKEHEEIFKNLTEYRERLEEFIKFRDSRR